MIDVPTLSEAGGGWTFRGGRERVKASLPREITLSHPSAY